MNESNINQLLFNSSVEDWTKIFDGDPPIGVLPYDGLILVFIVILSICIVLIIIQATYKKYKRGK